MTTHQNGTGLDAQGKLRVLAGVHTGGGQWAVAQQREQFGASLSRLSFIRGNQEYRYHLASRLQEDGYVPAAAIFADAVVGDFNARERESFWKNDAVVSEYGSGVPKIRERLSEFTARRPRQRYGNGQTSITMPSKAAILTDLRHYGATSIDFPVVVQDAGGFPVETVFRASMNKSGGWTTESLSDELNSPTYRRAEEIITASLEARRVTAALIGVDLDSAVLERRAAAGSKPQYIASTFIKAAAFIEGANVAILNLKGRAYGYKASREVFDRMISAAIPGKVFPEIRVGESVAVSFCGTCGKPYVVNSKSHACAVLASTPNEAAGLYEEKRRAKGLRSLLSR